jgi:hypothetical protein
MSPDALVNLHSAGFAGGFAAALLDPELAPASDIVGPRGKAAIKRYAVYRNNVTVSLIDALAATYPAVQRLVGADFFRAMARFHLRASPPTSPLLLEYGRDFPAFIATYEYARDLPYLADVARVERAWLDAYHAADMDPLAAAALADIAPEGLAEIRLVAHPATRILRSAYSATSIFAANRGAEAPERLDASEAEDALVTRPDMEVAVRRLPPGGAVFVTSLVGGATLGEAAADAFAEASNFDLGASLAGMIEAGAFTSLVQGDAS